MQALLHANLSTLTLSRSFAGGAFNFPKLTAGSDVVLRLRLTEEVEGANALAARTINSIRASVGEINARPTAGTYKLTIDLAGGNETASIDWDATATEIQTAINTAIAAQTTIHPCTVIDPGGTGDFRIVFENNTLAPTVTCTDNALFPDTFVTVEQSTFDEGNVYHLRLVQAPVASVATFEEIVPAPPTVTQLQAGSTVDDVETNEIQKLHIPPEFAAGAFQLKRSGIYTEPIGLPTTAEFIATVLEPLADDGGEFTVTPVDNGVFIEFGGDMGGIAQDLLEVVVFDEPAADLQIILDTNTRALRTAMEGADATSGELELPFQIEIEVESEQTPGTYELAIFRTDLTFRGMVREDAYNVAADLVWNQPLSRTQYLAMSPDSLLIGHRSYSTRIGDGAATSFAINHNLGPTSTTFTAVAGTDVITATSHRLFNGDRVVLTTTTTLPAGLALATDYWVINRTDNTLKLSSTAGGAAVDITDTGTGTHTITRNDGSAAGVHLTVVNLTTSVRVADNAYTTTFNSENQLTLSGFSGTPTLNQYLVLITTVGQPATYQSHTHPISEVTGLQDALDALSDRVASLESLAPTGSSTTRLATTAVKVARWPLPTLWEVYPTRTVYERPTDGEITLFINEVGSTLRGGGLLPAQHDSSAGNLSAVLSGGELPAAANHTGSVFTNNANGEITLAGGRGRRTAYLQNDEWVASDGTNWYRVTPYERQEAGHTFTANSTTDILTATDHQLIEGTLVQVSTTTTLPGGLSAATDYYTLRLSPDTFQLAATEGGAAINITTTGNGTHTVTQQAETSYYPTDFERELFAFSVNSRQLILKSTLELNIGLELAIVKPDRRARERETRAHWSIVIEIGRYPQTSSPATTGLNLGAEIWDPNPIAEQRVIVTPVPTVHTIGLEVMRELVGGVDTLTANALHYGNAESTWAPYELPFAVRGRLVRFDTEDSVSDPRGLVVISGLARISGDAESVEPLGLARIV